MYKNLLLLIVFGLVGSAMAQMPATFDLRDVEGANYVTSVKSQEGGTCWTHGTMASMEGNLLITGNWELNGETGEPALAEYHLDWWNGYNSCYNADLNPPFDNGEGLDVHYGGDYRVVTAYLSRLDGAVREVDGQSYNNPPDFSGNDFHYYYPKDVEWYTAGANLENLDTIKQKVMDYGVMAICMCWDGNFFDYDLLNHYQPPSSNLEPNHSVAIIGWDDNHNTQAPEPGAWLVKNSWGPGWGNDGYFWISYYDKQACQNPEMGAVSFIDVDLMEWDTAYYHDYHGWRDTLKFVDQVFNAFTAAEDEAIVAVNFFTAQSGVDYIAKIYNSFDGTTLSDELSSVSGTFMHSGLHTVVLSDTANIFRGDNFYVFLSLDNGGIAYDRTSEVPVLLGASTRVEVPSTASEGESFYFDEGVWVDFYNYDDPSGFQNTGNFCIKAIAIHDPTLRLNSKPYKHIKFNVFPNPFTNSLYLGFYLEKDSFIQMEVYAVDGRLVYNYAEELMFEGDINLPINLENERSGVYFVNVKIDGITVSTKKIIKN